MRPQLGSSYKSASQRARVISESWAAENLYCPACACNSLGKLAANTKSIDFECLRCSSGFQLKSASRKFGECINDGAYTAMRQTILSGRTPSLFMLHYDLASWTVQNLTIVPSFAFTLSCLQRRAALSVTAERAGWVGCNILISSIPQDARIQVVSDGAEEKREKVRRKFKLLRPISELNAMQRGWTLDVLNVVRSLKKNIFDLSEVLGSSDELQKLHPENRHVEAKVRQQLQRLRDLGLIEFVNNRGTYKLRRID